METALVLAIEAIVVWVRMLRSRCLLRGRHEYRVLDQCRVRARVAHGWGHCHRDGRGAD